MRDEEDLRKQALVDTSTDVEIDSLPLDSIMPTLTTSPSGTSSSAPSNNPGDYVAPPSPRYFVGTTASRPTIIYTMLLNIGYQAYYADVCAYLLKVMIPKMIG